MIGNKNYQEWENPLLNCHDYFHEKKLNENDENIMDEIDKVAKQESLFEFPNVYRNEDESCSSYLQRRHFIQTSQSQEEANFPIAYSVLVYRDYPQVEMLLRTIYRPEHAICIHVDAKSPEILKKALENLVKCFDENSLFVAPESLDVVWGEFSVLEADLICMRHLWNRRDVKKWKYFINLSGQEFPLRTNLELVRIFKIYNGANNIEVTKEERLDRSMPVQKMNFSMNWIRGAPHIVASAAFVEFCLFSPKAKEILRVLQGNKHPHPDELFFATLNHNPKLAVPGAYALETNKVDYPFLTRFKIWAGTPTNENKIPCKSGKIVRVMCIWGIEDLPTLIKRQELFVNKFLWDFQHVTLQCLQQWYWNRTEKEQITNHVDVNLAFYENLSFVRYHRNEQHMQ